jgi:hypothetical protein
VPSVPGLWRRVLLEGEAPGMTDRGRPPPGGPALAAEARGKSFFKCSAHVPCGPKTDAFGGAHFSEFASESRPLFGRNSKSCSAAHALPASSRTAPAPSLTAGCFVKSC